MAFRRFARHQNRGERLVSAARWQTLGFSPKSGKKRPGSRRGRCARCSRSCVASPTRTFDLPACSMSWRNGLAISPYYLSDRFPTVLGDELEGCRSFGDVGHADALAGRAVRSCPSSCPCVQSWGIHRSKKDMISTQVRSRPAHHSTRVCFASTTKHCRRPGSAAAVTANCCTPSSPLVTGRATAPALGGRGRLSSIPHNGSHAPGSPRIAWPRRQLATARPGRAGFAFGVEDCSARRWLFIRDATARGGKREQKRPLFAEGPRWCGAAGDA